MKILILDQINVEEEFCLKASFCIDQISCRDELLLKIITEDNQINFWEELLQTACHKRF